MNYILLKIIITLYAFIVTNPQIPQDVKDRTLQVVSENMATVQQDSCAIKPADNTTTKSVPKLDPSHKVDEKVNESSNA